MSDNQQDLLDNKQQFIKSRKKRNIALGFILFMFIIMVYFVTIFKLGPALFR